MTISQHRWAHPVSYLSLVVVAMAAVVGEAAEVSRVSTSSDWPGWRGPHRDGVATTDATLPLEWSDESHVIWQVNVPGRGHGSPCVFGDAIYLATCDEGDGSQSVLAFDRATGERRWQRQVHADGGMRKNERSTAASATVACDGKAAYITFPNNGRLVASALSTDGQLLWQTTICDYEVHQGYGASPLLYGDTVIVAADNKLGGAVAALNRATGDIVWQVKRPATPNYPSPIVHHLFGRDQLIMTGCDKVVSYDPTNGDVIWEIAGATTECVTTTVTDGERVYSSGGYPRNHVAAIRADGSGTIDWDIGQRLYVPSMVYLDGHLYAVLDAGIAVCWNSATGEERWKQRLGGTFSASPVVVGDTILATNEAGQSYLFRATPDQYEALGENQLGDEVFASPAVCGGRIYFRVADHDGDVRQERLVCIGN